MDDKDVVISAASAAAAKYGTATTTAMAGVSFLGWLSLTEWLTIAGFILGLLSFCVDIFNKQRIHKRHEAAAAEASKQLFAEEMRAQEEHMIRMSVLRAELANEQIIGN
jgi:hypothetical protein